MKAGKKAVMMLAAICAAAMFFSAGGFCAEKMSAVVVYVSGDAQLKRAGGRESAALKVNDYLSPGDSVVTSTGARASLVTKGGAEVRINESTTFEVPGKTSARETYELKVGQLWSRMLHRMAKLNVRTTSAICAVRGTEADIEQRDMMTVKVYEGHVDLNNSAGKQSLKAGQISTVAGASVAPAAPRAMTAAEIGKWQEGIDVKDIAKYLERVGAGGGKKLKLTIDKDGASKNVDGDLKKK